MADWSILQSSRTDFLSSLTSYNKHETSLPQYHMMNSYIERSFTPHNVYDGDTSFCTQDNIDQCVQQINQELTGLGFKPISQDGIGRTTSLINALHEIIMLYQRSGHTKEELENRLHRVNSDVSHNQAEVRRLKSEKERLEREVAQEREKHRQTHGKVKAITAKFKAEKDELKRLQSVIKDRDGQYKHEMKKKQREINKLKERLHQLLVDKNPDRRIGMDVVGLIHRGDTKRGRWKHTAASNKQEDMYQLLVANYEDKQQELRLENSDLRDCLHDMQRQLSSLADTTSTIQAKPDLLSASSSDTDLSMVSTSSVSHELTDELFQMPYDLMRETVHKCFNDTCRKIRDNIRKCSDSSSNTQSEHASPSHISSHSKLPSSQSADNRDRERRSEDLEKLRKQIDKYKEIVKQQEELIQQSLHTQSKSMENSFIQESQILQEKESLSEQRRKFFQEKANFEEEKKHYAETALQLQLERKQIEAERTNLMQSQFLQMSPYSSKPPTPQRSPSKGDRARLLPSTPVFSPAPGKATSPSSAELFKVLAMSRRQASLPEQPSPSKCSVPMSTSNESITSSSRLSAHSAPCDLRSTKHLSIEDMEEIEKTLFARRQRRSSTGSQSSLDGQ